MFRAPCEELWRPLSHPDCIQCIYRVLANHDPIQLIFPLRPILICPGAPTRALGQSLDTGHARSSILLRIFTSRQALLCLRVAGHSPSCSSCASSLVYVFCCQIFVRRLYLQNTIVRSMVARVQQQIVRRVCDGAFRVSPISSYADVRSLTVYLIV